MQFSTMQEIVDDISYKPGWSILLKQETDQSRRPYIQVSVDETAEASMDPRWPDRRAPWRGGKHYLSQHMTRQEVVGVVFGAIKAAEEHETREWFRYSGASIFNPHLDPDKLAGFIKKMGRHAFDLREDPMNMKEATHAA